MFLFHSFFIIAANKENVEKIYRKNQRITYMTYIKSLCQILLIGETWEKN